MAALEAQKRTKLAAIAPISTSKAGSIDRLTSESMSELPMPYACQNCARRKVKCNKASPVCSSCRRGKHECNYQEPPPRVRKRKPDENVLEKLARYERILQHHGLLGVETPNVTSTTSPQDPISLRLKDQETSERGKLLASQGKSRYVNSGLWRTLGEDEMQNISDHEEGEEVTIATGDSIASDPLTEAFLNSYQNLAQYHPPYEKALALWETHVENVEPLCKILHVPSMDRIIRTSSREPEKASKVDECLMFAIYHFAVFSMTEDECVEKLGQSKALLMQNYHLATRKALANASFLKTTEISVLQALVLFLIPCRFYYDPHTYWILTGVAARIAQRMGLHRDGEKFGLSPFEVQMKRRLFYQILPLEGISSQLSGVGMAITADAWDTQLPLNMNDDQIWPGMTESPQVKKGATEMIFCLSRSYVGKFMFKFGGGMMVSNKGSSNFEDPQEAERAISEAEGEIEESFIRYCDIINPLHFLTIGLARSGITALRIKIRLPKIKDQTATDAESKEILRLAQSVLDTDAAAYGNKSLMKFGWYMKPFFLWGMWDSFILVLTSLWKRRDLFSPAESNAAWKRVEQVYMNHEELAERRRALYMALGRLAVRAWDARPESDNALEPPFITTLRLPRKLTSSSATSQAERQGSTLQDAFSENTTAVLPPHTSFLDNMSALNTHVGPETSLDAAIDFGIDAGDWVWWEQLMQDYQEQGEN